MACASFLKFHPTLPKQGALVVTRAHHIDIPIDKRQKELSKEERARQRHSVEVSNAGNYLHIQPSTLESLTRSAANASANRSRPRKLQENTIKEDVPATEGYGFHTISVLPPALKCLVFLWEELTSNCVQAIAQQMIVNSSIYSKAKKCEKLTTKSSDGKERVVTVEKESTKSRKKKAMSRNYVGNLILLCLTCDGGKYA